MDRLTSLRVFREVVEAGSFARAAARLSLSAPMASKHLAQLERELGARLLHRTSRRLSPQPRTAGAAIATERRASLTLRR